MAAAAAQRVLLKEGTRLSVYWPGSEEWFETRVLGHRATVDPESGLLTFKHQCLYEGGNIEHDLGKTEYELVEPQSVEPQPVDAPAPASGAAPQSERERDSGQAMRVLSVGVAVSKKARLALRRAPKKGHHAAAPKGKATKYSSNAYGE